MANEEDTDEQQHTRTHYMDAILTVLGGNEYLDADAVLAVLGPGYSRNAAQDAIREHHKEHATWGACWPVPTLSFSDSEHSRAA